MACQDATRSGGYYYGGSWYPMMYRYPYPYYYDHYRTHVSNGGRGGSAPAGGYARAGGAGAAPGGGPGGGGGLLGRDTERGNRCAGSRQHPDRTGRRRSRRRGSHGIPASSRTGMKRPSMNSPPRKWTCWRQPPTNWRR